VLRSYNNLASILLFLLSLLHNVVVIRDGLFHIEIVVGFILHCQSQIFYFRKLRLDVVLLILNGKGVLVLLELVETALDHVVWVGKNTSTTHCMSSAVSSSLGSSGTIFRRDADMTMPQPQSVASSFM